MAAKEHNTEVEDLLRSTLAAHSSLYLATCGDLGPWVNGVYFAETDLFTLSLALEQRGRTLAAIRQAPRVAVIVSTGSPGDPFLQAQATAEVVTGDAAEEVRRVLLAKVPAVEPFFSAPIETVTLRVDQWRVTDMRHGWFPGREFAAPQPA
jgi:nitroimidazol reductase NimA-like FMN-containing flavoprotein (pyridoxamine 5'-phosphate oxidase superfamily)